MKTIKAIRVIPRYTSEVEEKLMYLYKVQSQVRDFIKQIYETTVNPIKESKLDRKSYDMNFFKHLNNDSDYLEIKKQIKKVESLSIP